MKNHHIIKKISLATALIFGCSVGFAKTQFCVTNNAGMNMDLKVVITETFDIPIGTLDFVSGWTIDRNNEACIVTNKSKSGNRSITNYESVGDTHYIKYAIYPFVAEGNYSPITCEKSYPSEWGWPAKMVANVSLVNGRLVCDLTINPPKNNPTNSPAN